MSRVLIVNADDFGRSEQITAGILRAHEEGIVTSTSAMVRPPSARRALRRAAEHPVLSVGLHLDFGEWTQEAYEWVLTDDVVDLDDAAAVEREARAQLERFRELAGHDPTHLDSHQHAHRRGPAHEAAARIAAELGVPLRDHHPGVRYCGWFYGRNSDGSPFPGGISVEGLTRIIRELPEGVTELGCHPAEAGVDDASYGPERAEELRTLCDPRVHRALRDAGVTLCSFSSLPSRA